MNREELARITKEAGRVALKYYNKNYTVTTKSDNSPVTEADMAVHKYLTVALEATDIPILSEEGSAGVISDTDKLWVIDPIDGTKDFIQKTGDFAVMVALVEVGVPNMTAVYVPAADEIYSAEKDKGAFLKRGDEEERIHVSKISDSKDARLLVSRNHPNKVTARLEEELGISRVIPVGSMGVKLVRIARGDADICLYSTNKLGWWDVAAPQLILEEAGGKVTDVNGAVIRYEGNNTYIPNGVLASNGFLHHEAVCVLR